MIERADRVAPDAANIGFAGREQKSQWGQVAGSRRQRGAVSSPYSDAACDLYPTRRSMIEKRRIESTARQPGRDERQARLRHPSAIDQPDAVDAVAAECAGVKT